MVLPFVYILCIGGIKMKHKKKNTKTWVIVRTKSAAFTDKMFVVFAIYIIYRLGYATGTFLAFMGC